MGYADGRSFGFAACERAVGASEGINAVMQRRLPRAAGRVRAAAAAQVTGSRVWGYCAFVCAAVCGNWWRLSGAPTAIWVTPLTAAQARVDSPCVFAAAAVTGG